MCLATIQLADSAPYKKSIFRNGWENNPDGGGYMFARGGRVIIRKGFTSWEAMRAEYMADHKKYGRFTSFALHFRWTTHGKHVDNCHPHQLCEGQAALVHNGILTRYVPPATAGDISDTVHFCRTGIHTWTPNDLVNPANIKPLGEHIGKGNKLILMVGNGDFSIINEESGHWTTDGKWYSNYGYKRSKVYTSSKLIKKWEKWAANTYADDYGWPDYKINASTNELIELVDAEDASTTADDLAELTDADFDAMDEQQWAAAVQAMDREDARRQETLAETEDERIDREWEEYKEQEEAIRSVRIDHGK